jgi:hypothetical protein
MGTKTNKKSKSGRTIKNKLSYITDTNGNRKAVVVPIEQYLKMLEELEDNRDIKTADDILKHSPKFVKYNSQDYK